MSPIELEFEVRDVFDALRVVAFDVNFCGLAQIVLLLVEGNLCLRVGSIAAAAPANICIDCFDWLLWVYLLEPWFHNVDVTICPKC